MNTTLKPQSASRVTRFITIFLVLVIILAGGGLLSATRYGDEVIAPVMMFLLALGFSVIAAWSKKNQWAIIPAGIFASIGLGIALDILIQESEVTGHFYRFQVLIPRMEILIPNSEVTGLIFMFLFTATFLFFASLSKKNWWAIIPAGLFASIGLVVVLEMLVPHEEFPEIQGMLSFDVLTWVLFLGLAATFGTLWLLRKSRPTSWAIYPAVGFLAITGLFIIEGAHFSEYWLETTLAVLGATLLLALLTRKMFSLPLMIIGTILALLLLAACSPQTLQTPTSPTPIPTSTPQPARIEEITFQSGEFTLVGDLRLPAGSGPFPLVIFVHGSGDVDRIASGVYLPIMKRMQQAGYATFAWDKPGTGESTGTFTQEILKHQRAKILLEAIEVMKARPDIDTGQIGLSGASQAGYVMPRIFSESDDIDFLICESCAGMSGVDQMAFQVTALALCSEVPAKQAAEKERLLAELNQARTYETYEEYLHYRETLAALAKIVSAPINDWPALSEAVWQTNDPEIENWWNPMGVIEQVRFPVLAIYGDQDRQIDPQQGAIAYRRALELAGNPKSRVELFAGANHAIIVSESGCPKDQLAQLEQYVKSQGFASLQEAQEAFLANPDDPRLLEAFPFAPGYLDLIEEWLRSLKH